MPRSPALVLLAALAGAAAPALAQDAPAEEAAPFALKGMEVVAERDAPQACLTFTRRLERPKALDYERFVSIEPPTALTPVVRDSSLCLEGLSHGGRYRLTVKAGLPGALGARLPSPAGFEVEVPDRAAAVAFRSGGYVLPRLGAEGLSLRTTNVDRVRLAVLRIEDRDLVERAYFGRVSHALSDAQVGELLDKAGEPIWRGEVPVAARRNQVAVTELPVDAMLGDPKPGVYVAVADDADNPPAGWSGRATQWFISSDIGLTTFQGEDGLAVFARSLASAAPLPDVELRLLAYNRAEIGRARTDEDGVARFPAEAFKGTGITAAQALVAATEGGDFNLLDLAAAGQRPPQPAASARAVVRPERGAYRPGERASVTVLLRDQAGRAAGGKPLTLRLARPDGLEVARQEVREAGAGGYAAAVQLPPAPFPGAWTLSAHLEPEGPAVGSAEIRVGEFMPARLGIELSADRDAIDGEGPIRLEIGGRLLNGAPAAGLSGEVSLALRPADAPFPEHSGFRFGLAQEGGEAEPARREIAGFTTDAEGRARVEATMDALPPSTRPVEAVIRASIVDLGGGSVEREIVLPVRSHEVSIGLRPRFDGDAVPENATAGVEVVAVGRDGRRIAADGLGYELFEELVEHDWFEANGKWDYRVRLRDRRLAGGTVDVAADAPGLVEQPVGSGRFRLEVFDRKTGAASSVRFTAGWWVAPIASDRPDAVELRVMKPRHAAGESATVFVRPPYESQVLVAVAGERRIHRLLSRRVGPEGAFLEIPVDGAWNGGANLLATAFAPADPTRRMPPRRALGRAWLGLDLGPRRLEVEILAPERVEASAALSLPVQVRGGEEDAPVFVTVSAVDEALLAQRDAPDPDPLARLFGRQPLGISVRDVFGRLLQPQEGQPAENASAPPSPERPARGDAAPRGDRPLAPLAARGTAAVQSQVLRVGPDGKVEVPIALPDFEGRLRLTAIAWSPGRMGHAVAGTTVSTPVAVSFEPPRFLRRGDSAELAPRLIPHEGDASGWKVRAAAEGPATVTEVGAASLLRAAGLGTARLRLSAEGPDGRTLARDWALPVRPAAPPLAETAVLAIEPGSGAQAAAPRPEAGDRVEALALSVGPAPHLEQARLLMEVAEAETAGAERLLGVAVPLLRAWGPVVALGLHDEAGLRQRLQAEIERLLTFQRADGAFGLWSAEGAAEPWLTAHAAEFLLRSREAGLSVPDQRLGKALAWLGALLDTDWFDAAELPARAYAYAVLARAKAIDAAELSFFLDTGSEALPTPLARAHLAYALAASGDAEGARRALGGASAPRGDHAGLRDWGSDLRDAAAAIAVLAEQGLASGEELTERASSLAAAVASAGRLSPQERSWTIQAAQAVAQLSGPFSLRLDGEEVKADRPVLRRIEPGRQPPRVEALDRPLTVAVAALRAPGGFAPAAGEGLRVSRALFDPAGRPADLAAVRQGDRLVVVIEGESLTREARQLLLTDPLPAGFAVESVRRPRNGAPGGLPWLGEVTAARHLARRDDRISAVVDVTAESPRFRLAYVVRAVTAGRFGLPPAALEDVERPAAFARSAARDVTILPAPGGMP
jgi:uncharacterized protein YfaS (alpha-2-macroglobulin family)